MYEYNLLLNILGESFFFLTECCLLMMQIIYFGTILKHVAIAGKNIYEIVDNINYKIYNCIQNLFMMCRYEVDFEHSRYQCCLFISFLFFLGYRLTALVNRKNFTNLVTRFRIRIQRFLAMSLRATRTLHKATITTVLNMYLIFLNVLR